MWFLCVVDFQVFAPSVPSVSAVESGWYMSCVLSWWLMVCEVCLFSAPACECDAAMSWWQTTGKGQQSLRPLLAWLWHFFWYVFLICFPRLSSYLCLEGGRGSMFQILGFPGDMFLTCTTKASSSSSSSSAAVEAADSLDDSSSVSGSETEFPDLFPEDVPSSEDEGCDRFADLVTAKPDHSYRGHTVHFWTLPYSAREDRKTAENSSPKQIMRVYKQVCGTCLEYYAIFKEYHAASSKEWERKPHFHICLKLNRRVKWIRIAQALRRNSIYAHLSLPTRFLCFWRVIAYCYVPSCRKPLSELDPDPLFSSKFPIDQLEKKCKGKSKSHLRPWDFYQIIRKIPSIQTYADCVTWAQEQQRKGAPQYMEFMARQGSKMGPLFTSWRQLMVGRCTLKSLREDRLAMWNEALASPCVCPTPDRLQNGLDDLLSFHEKDGERFSFLVQRMIRIGTALKSGNLLVYGASNAGKTCLTRPLLSIFKHKAFVRPNRNDTFPLQGLENYLVACWQDRRHTLSPIGWDTILLLLEGESVQAAVKGGASVTVETPPPFIITAQEKIIPLSSKGVPDQAEAEAFQNRFCLRWHLRKALPKSQQDPQMKLAMRCGSCYSKWIDRNAAAYKLRAPDMEEQVIEMERAIQGEPAQLEQPARLPIEVSAAEAPVLTDHPASSSDRNSALPFFSSQTMWQQWTWQRPWLARRSILQLQQIWNALWPRVETWMFRKLSLGPQMDRRLWSLKPTLDMVGQKWHLFSRDAVNRTLCCQMIENWAVQPDVNEFTPVCCIHWERAMPSDIPLAYSHVFWIVDDVGN